jgi:hypothetical protein
LCYVPNRFGDPERVRRAKGALPREAASMQAFIHVIIPVLLTAAIWLVLSLTRAEEEDLHGPGPDQRDRTL